MVDWKVLSNEGVNESDILMDLTQRYVFKVGGAEKTVRSLVTLQRDSEGKSLSMKKNGIMNRIRYLPL